MFHIAVCDDHYEFLQYLVEIARKITEKLAKCDYFYTTKVEHMLNHLSTSHVDLVMLDISMPDIDGLELAKRIDVKSGLPLLIFVSSYEIMVFEAIKCKPHRFVRKDHLEDLEEALTSAIQTIYETKGMFTYKSQFTSEEVTLPVYQIVYLESQHNSVRIVSTNGSDSFRNTVKRLEDWFAPYDFIRARSGLLINPSYVYQIHLTYTILQYNGRFVSLPITRRSRSDLAKWLLEHSR